MDGMNNLGLAARRTEDIALDLMKYVADTTGVARLTGPAAGFGGAASQKPEDHVNQLLDLYGRCLKAVEANSERGAAR